MYQPMNKAGRVPDSRPIQNETSPFEERLTILESKIDSLENVIGYAIDKMDKLPQPVPNNRPDFLKNNFWEDIEQEPAETVTDMVADLYNIKPDMFMNPQESAKIKFALERLLNLSRHSRKEKLLKQNEDAWDILEEMEEVFKDIPEIAHRPDAYEIAYKLIVAKKDGESKGYIKEGKKKNSDSRTPDKERAFVEGRKTASNRSRSMELNPTQKDICKKLGISEDTFKKYMKEE